MWVTLRVLVPLHDVNHACRGLAGVKDLVKKHKHHIMKKESDSEVSLKPFLHSNYWLFLTWTGSSHIEISNEMLRERLRSKERKLVSVLIAPQPPCSCSMHAAPCDAGMSRNVLLEPVFNSQTGLRAFNAGCLLCKGPLSLIAIEPLSTRSSIPCGAWHASVLLMVTTQGSENSACTHGICAVFQGLRACCPFADLEEDL
jgi:hypothetical protein